MNLCINTSLVEDDKEDIKAWVGSEENACEGSKVCGGAGNAFNGKMRKVGRSNVR